MLPLGISSFVCLVGVIVTPLKVVILLMQPCHVRLCGIPLGLCGVGTLLFGGNGVILGLDLGQQLLHPLAVPGGCGELFGAARAGNQVQVLAGQLRQAF